MKSSFWGCLESVLVLGVSSTPFCCVAGSVQISSASNCTDYQARRLNIRYRPSPAVAAAGETENGAGAKGGKGKGKKQAQAPPRFAHTLNATAVAVPRMIISILETFQQEDGSVLIPEPLQPFMGGRTVLKPKANAH